MDSVDSATMVGKCYLFGVSRALGKNWKQVYAITGLQIWKQLFLSRCPSLNCPTKIYPDKF